MLLCKEWIETRFTFLTAFSLMTGLVLSIPPGMNLSEQYWLGMLSIMFTQAVALALGSGAFAGERDAGTLEFLVSKPVGRFKILAVKYCVRFVEVALLFLYPVMIHRTRNQGFDMEWLRVPPYPFIRFAFFAVFLCLFVFSLAFLFSAILKRQALCALAAVGASLVYVAGRGMAIFQDIYYSYERIPDREIYLLAGRCLACFLASLFVFRLKEI